MKFLIQTLAVALLCFALQYFFPWWTLAIGAFVVGLVFGTNGWISFFSGLLGAGLLWLTMALIIDTGSQSVLSTKVAALFPTKTVPLLFVLTALVGGLVGGFASLTGSIFTYRKRPRW